MSAGPEGNPWTRCPCGHLSLWHDIEEYSGDASEMCCVEGCDQALWCPGAQLGGGVVTGLRLFFSEDDWDMGVLVDDRPLLSPCLVCGRATDTPPECGNCHTDEDTAARRREDV